MNLTKTSVKIIESLDKLRLLFRVLIVMMYLSLMLPWYVDVLAVSVIIFVTSKIRGSDMVLTLISFGFSIFLAEIFLITWDDTRIYYRPHEKWAAGNGRYSPNVDDRMEIPYGDLVAIAGGQKSEAFDLIAEPRTVDFLTDSIGYRNGDSYETEDLILVGDSFIAGIGTDQLDTLAYQLGHGKNVSAYSIGFPGKGASYALRAETFLVDYPEPSGKFVFFFFEGNDFKKLGAAQAVSNFFSHVSFLWSDRSDQLLYDRVRLMLLKSLKYPKLVYGITRQRNPNTRVHILNVRGTPVGFLSSYIENTVPVKRKRLDFPVSQQVLANTSCVLFIPTKYRVYAPFIDQSLPIAEPSVYSKQLEEFADVTKVKFHDLTDDLRSEAGKLMTEGKFVFWRDDTHWNGLGIRVASEWVADNCS